MFISVTEQYMGTIEIKAEMCIIILYMMVVQDPIRETAEAQWLGSFSHFQLSVGSKQWAVGSKQWAVGSGQWAVYSGHSDTFFVV